MMILLNNMVFKTKDNFESFVSNVMELGQVSFNEMIEICIDNGYYVEVINETN